MQKNHVPIKRALISVSNKKGLIEFAQGLSELAIEIITTGGTHRLLRDAHIPVKEISEVTHFPEMMDGRVKTLHPKIHGGILGRRDKHADVATEYNIPWIDLVVVNLYPFAETIKRSNVTLEEAIENIDIGGPAMIRSAAKNSDWTAVLVDPNDYHSVLDELRCSQGLSATMRGQLATKAFAHTAEYDRVIHQFLQNYTNPEKKGNSVQITQTIQHEKQPTVTTPLLKNLPQTYNSSQLDTNLVNHQGFPAELHLCLEKSLSLRYGENPHQAAAAYRFLDNSEGILSAKQLQGKQLSYNNITDADAAIACLQEFTSPTCVIVKHANPCGVASAEEISRAFHNAYQADSQSAFGGVVVLNRPCTLEIAKMLEAIFIEIVIAPAYDPEGLSLLHKKTNLRILELPQYIQRVSPTERELKFIKGGVLIQESDSTGLAMDDLRCVTQRQPNAQETNALLFAWKVVKHMKSNAILIAKENETLGIGAGQVSRVDAVRLALDKAILKTGEGVIEKSVLASDAFFPFRDSIDLLAKSKIKAIIQPGGSIRDEEVIAACDEYEIAMVFTGQRCFKH